MHVQIDPIKCACTGFCERVAPSVFRTPASGPSEVIDPNPPPERHDAVREAADMCPAGAIQIEQTQGD